MHSRIALLTLVALLGCYGGKVSLGTCDLDGDCSVRLRGSVCENHVCTYACPAVCKVTEQCVDAQCVGFAPAVSQPIVPGWTSRSNGAIVVTAVIDGTETDGIASAVLQIAGVPDVPGTTQDQGLVRTYRFMVSGSVQTPGSDTPIDFKIVAVAPKGGKTPDEAAGRGKLLIDDARPTLAGAVVVQGGTTGADGLQWFRRAGGNIDVAARIRDSGSGVNVDPAALSLTLVGTNARLDTGGAPACIRASASDVQECHFFVPSSFVAAGTQRRLDFVVNAFDYAGNAIAANNASLGIDGKAPTISFSVGPSGTTAYPPAGAGCSRNDPGLIACGHDGSHFWKAGDGSYTLNFTVDDAYDSPRDGSGADPRGSTCTIAGVPTCSVTYDAASRTFRFPAEFGTANVTTGPDGTGTVSSITVTAQDIVGNPAAPITLSLASLNPVAITRVKWIRKEAVNLSVPPVLSSQLGLVIVAGAVTSGDSIFAINMTDGSRAWKAGAASPTIGSVTGSLALDTTPSSDVAHPSPILYANAGTNVFAMHFTVDRVDKYCSQAPSTTNLVGSPVIFGGGASAHVIAASQDAVVAFSTNLSASGGGCLQPMFYTPNPAPVFGPPSAKDDVVYFGYDNHAMVPGDFGIWSIKFSGGSFTAPNRVNLGKQPTTNLNPAAITPASDLFYGINKDGKFFRYKSDFSGMAPNWPAPMLPTTANIVAQPLVVNSVVYGSADAFYAYSELNAVLVSGFPITTGGSQMSSPTIGSNSFFIANNAPTPSVTAFTLAGVKQWAYSGGPAATLIATIATEGALSSDGVLYFGDAAGKIYALFTDATPLIAAPGDWPRTGYDNCNSNHANNPGFICQ